MCSINQKRLTDVLAIVGPTAVGKTAVAIELARGLGGEIVSADSMAVYTGMDIGTAKPDQKQGARARFHLIDVADPGRTFSVGDYQILAHSSIDDITRRSPPAIVVGGSGLYVRAAIDGLDAAIPPQDPAIRQILVEEAHRHGKQHIHNRLARVDAESARRIHPNNVKRVIRALEIYQTTGVPASELFEQDSKRPPRYPQARLVGLTMKRPELYARIDQRVDAMIEAGLVDEVRRLLERGVDPALPSMQGLGYKETVGYIQGAYGKNEAVALIKKNTRRFAKRQFTWFNADPRVKWIDVCGLTAEEVSSIVKELIE